VLKSWIKKKGNGKAMKGEDMLRAYDIVLEAIEMLKGFKAESESATWSSGIAECRVMEYLY
jgi:hypothetical protein